MTLLTHVEGGLPKAANPSLKNHPSTWQKISLEPFFSPRVELARLQGAGCKLNDLAIGMIGRLRGEIGFHPITLVRASAPELGLAGPATYPAIRARAKEFGLVPCPAAVAVALRRSYWHEQPLHECLIIAPTAELLNQDQVLLFVLKRDTGGRWLEGRRIPITDRRQSDERFVFRRLFTPS